MGGHPLAIELHRRYCINHRTSLTDAQSASNAYAYCLDALACGHLLLDSKAKTALMAVRALVLQGPVNALDHSLDYLPNMPVSDVSDEFVSGQICCVIGDL